MPTVQAEPYPFEFDPRTCALVIIDMQRDFLEPGGFGETLGNDVSLLRRTIAPIQALLAAARAARPARHPHARRPPPRSRRPAAREEGARRGSTVQHRRRGPDGPHPRPRRGRARHHPRARTRARRSRSIDKPGKGAFYATDLHAILHIAASGSSSCAASRPRSACNTTVREANDRGYDCLVPADCVGSYFPEFHAVALKMIKAQGGIFGWVANSSHSSRRSADAARATRTGRHHVDRIGRDPSNTAAVGTGRLERLLRLRHQHPRQPAGADRRCCASCSRCRTSWCSGASCPRPG